MSWTAKNKGTDWTGKPILPIHTGIYADPLKPPIALVHTETAEGKARAAMIAATPALLKAACTARSVLYNEMLLEQSEDREGRATQAWIELEAAIKAAEKELA